MRPSSISSSDGRAASSSDGRVAPGSARQWPAFLLLVLALLAAAEAALRLPEVRSLLPPRTHYYHPAIAQRIDAIDLVKLAHGRIDVLFLGSSIVHTNVHPLLFDSLALRLPRQVVSFNAGLSGLWPTGVHLYARHVWLPLTKPRVVVQGVRHAEIAATTHAKNDTQVWSGRIEPAWRDTDWSTRLYAATVSRVFLLQYYGALTRELQDLRNGRDGSADPDDVAPVALRGHSPRPAPATASIETWAEDLPNDGRCTPTRCEVGFTALRRTIAAARAEGAVYVLVNVPEHPARWRGPDALERYRHYVNGLARFAEEEGIGFIDPTDGDPRRFAYTPYNDFAHMTAAGAGEFTRELARRMAPILERAIDLPDMLHAGDRSSRSAPESTP